MFGFVFTDSGEGFIAIILYYRRLCAHQGRGKLALFFQITLTVASRVDLRRRLLIEGAGFFHFPHELESLKLAHYFEHAVFDSPFVRRYDGVVP